MKKNLLLVLLLSLSIPRSFAQDADDYKFFVTDVGDFLNLYRGHVPLVYNFRTTGTYYAYSENFEKGFIRYNGKVYNDVCLNLNSHLDELNIQIGDSRRIVVLNPDFVEGFSYGGRNFVYYKVVDRSPRQVLQTGYYQILYNGNAKLYKKIKKNYIEKVGHVSIGKYHSNIERIFTTVESYYLIDGKYCYSFKKKSDLLSYYKNKRRELLKMSREKNLDFRHDKDHSFAEVLRFIESSTGN